MARTNNRLSAFRNQLEAIGSALILIQDLPEAAVWGLECTNDDDAENPTVLNIFVASNFWPALTDTLGLGEPIDRSEKFISYRQGTLLVSFIEEEAKNV